MQWHTPEPSHTACAHDVTARTTTSFNTRLLIAIATLRIRLAPMLLSRPRHDTHDTCRRCHRHKPRRYSHRHFVRSRLADLVNPSGDRWCLPPAHTPHGRSRVSR